METKLQILADLTESFYRWQALLASLGRVYRWSRLLPSGWTLKDTVAHLWFWQQASVARMGGGLHRRSPIIPVVGEIGPDPEEKVDQANAWNYARGTGTSPGQTFMQIGRPSSNSYLDLLSRVSEDNLLKPGRYAWMGKYSLSASSLGSLDHHREHYDIVKGWLGVHGE